MLQAAMTNGDGVERRRPPPERARKTTNHGLVVATRAGACTGGVDSACALALSRSGHRLFAAHDDCGQTGPRHAMADRPSLDLRQRIRRGRDR
jgi:hypothetical protein